MYWSYLSLDLLKFNPDKLYCSFFPLSPHLKLKTDKVLQPTYSVCFCLLLRARVRALVHARVCEWLTWTRLQAALPYSCWTFLTEESDLHFHPLVPSALFHKSVSCETAASDQILHLKICTSRKCRLASAAGKWQKKSGSFTVCGAAKELRALHLTAPLSERALNPRTIALRHLEEYLTLKMPSTLEIREETQPSLSKINEHKQLPGVEMNELKKRIYIYIYIL